MLEPVDTSMVTAPTDETSEPRIDDDWLRRIGPAHFSHINFRGTMRFGVERYADALVQRQSASATLANR